MFPSTTLLAAVTLALAGLGAASPAPASNATMTAPVGKRCTGTISSLADVAAAVKCTTININSFTVRAACLASHRVYSICSARSLPDVRHVHEHGQTGKS
jgi:hypothetical protein